MMYQQVVLTHCCLEWIFDVAYSIFIIFGLLDQSKVRVGVFGDNNYDELIWINNSGDSNLE